MARKENSKNLPKQLLKEQLERQKENQEEVVGGEFSVKSRGGQGEGQRSTGPEICPKKGHLKK